MSNLADRLETPTFRCIHFVPEDTPVPERELSGRGLRVAEISVDQPTDKHRLLADIAAVMHFPEYFGHNWDALEECLKDLSWIPANGYVLWLRGSTALWQQHTSVAGILVEVVLAVSEWWAEQEIPFHLVFAG